MKFQTTIFLLLICGRFSKGNPRQFPAMPGVNSRKDTKSNEKLSVPSDPTQKYFQNQPSHEQTTVVQSTIKLTTDQLKTDSQSPSDPPASVKLVGKNTTQLPSTPPQTTEILRTTQKTQSKSDRAAAVQSTFKETTERLGQWHSTTESPTTANLVDRELKSDQRTTRQKTLAPSTLHSGRKTVSKIKITNQLTYTPPTLPIGQELKSDQQTTSQLISSSPTSPTQWAITIDQQTFPSTLKLECKCNCANTNHNGSSCKCTVSETWACPNGSNSTDCVSRHECHYNEKGQVTHVSHAYENEDCTEKSTCRNHYFSCDSFYPCSPNAMCKVEDGIRKCSCRDGYVGDGETCQVYTDCYDAYQAGHRHDGVFTIFPKEWPKSSFHVWCDMTTRGGGWTILQRRLNAGGFEDKTWKHYEDGFGLTAGNHWLGNEKIFYLTNQRKYTLWVVVSSQDSTTNQEYSLFQVANASSNYRLVKLGSKNGTAGDGMDGLLGQQFSTSDRDNDGCDDIDCSKEHGFRGWWYSNKLCDKCCESYEETCFTQTSSVCKKRCTKANLNGWPGHSELCKGIFWNDQQIFSTEMKIRPAKRNIQHSITA